MADETSDKQLEEISSRKELTHTEEEYSDSNDSFEDAVSDLNPVDVASQLDELKAVAPTQEDGNHQGMASSKQKEEQDVMSKPNVDNENKSVVSAAMCFMDKMEVEEQLTSEMTSHHDICPPLGEVLESQSFEELRLSETSTNVNHCKPLTIQSESLDRISHTHLNDTDTPPSSNSQTTADEDSSIINAEATVISQTPQTHTITDNTSITGHSPISRHEDHTHSTAASSSSSLVASQTSGSGAIGSNTPASQPQQSLDSSSFVLVNSDGSSQVLDASLYEEAGLFFGADLRGNRKIIQEEHSPTPPPESADDVLLSENVVSELPAGKKKTRKKKKLSSSESSGNESTGNLINEEQDGVSMETKSDIASGSAKMGNSSGIDPMFIFELERRTKLLSQGLEDTIHGLQSNLQAMSVCALQAVSLQRETISSVQQTVDDSVKAMYTFLSKFNELNQNLQPIADLASQISDVNENLKTLERMF